MERIGKVLVVGASFAGLTTAYWMNKLGYKVTVAEIGSHLKKGGTPVDIKDVTVDIIKRMGLFEQIKASRLVMQKMEFKRADDTTGKSILLRQPGEEPSDKEFEIERDELLDMLFNLVKDNVTFVFNNTVADLRENDTGIDVVFQNKTKETYDLVFGCDGLHSVVRKIWFGNESEFAHYLGQYFSIAISNKLLIEQGTLQLYAEPNKGIMLNAYNHKTDIIFTFRSDKEIPYNFRDKAQPRQIVFEQMQGMQWRASELQEELLNADSFYFDKFCQIKMSSWTKGRVALVGDAAYCASPAAGMGGSLAIIGATALADAMASNVNNYEKAFEIYQNDLRPFIDEVQGTAVDMLDQLLPKSEEEITTRMEEGFSF